MIKIEQKKNIDDLSIEEKLTRRRVKLKVNVSFDLTSRKEKSLRDDIKIQSKKQFSKYFVNSKIERVRLLREKRRV